MAYLTFHFVFILPLIGLLALTLPRPLAGVGGPRARWAIPLICLIAFSYTTPWDNYLVAQNVWWYGPDRVIATIGYVPIEEYLFFILQPILTGLVLYQYLGRWPLRGASARPAARWIGAGFFAGLALLGAGFLYTGWDEGRYMGLILAWACPVLAMMWVYGGPQLWALRPAILAGVLPSTVYLWVVDAMAIRMEIWTISPDFSMGAVLGLPVEEATFFLVTNLLVVKGILLFLEDDLCRESPARRQNIAHLSQFE